MLVSLNTESDNGIRENITPRTLNKLVLNYTLMSYTLDDLEILEIKKILRFGPIAIFRTSQFLLIDVGKCLR
jgi:hypothetical protein